MIRATSKDRPKHHPPASVAGSRRVRCAGYDTRRVPATAQMGKLFFGRSEPATSIPRPRAFSGRTCADVGRFSQGRFCCRDRSSSRARRRRQGLGRLNPATPRFLQTAQALTLRPRRVEPDGRWVAVDVSSAHGAFAGRHGAGPIVLQCLPGPTDPVEAGIPVARAPPCHFAINRVTKASYANATDLPDDLRRFAGRRARRPPTRGLSTPFGGLLIRDDRMSRNP